MKQYKIKITGGGTFKEIVNALIAVANEADMILKENGEPGTMDIQWEDPILFTEITEDEE